jgi:hypothetical protein
MKISVLMSCPYFHCSFSFHDVAVKICSCFVMETTVIFIIKLMYLYIFCNFKVTFSVTFYGSLLTDPQGKKAQTTKFLVVAEVSQFLISNPVNSSSLQKEKINKDFNTLH